MSYLLYYFFYIQIHALALFKTGITALVSLLQDGEVDHGPVLEWCNKSHFILNTTKTKEMSIDFRKSQQTIDTYINGEIIQVVTNYKYLGIVLDNKLKWDSWTDLLHTKTQQRMYFLKKLFVLNVNNKMLQMFYTAFIESVLTCCIICWFGNATQAQKNIIRKTVTTASKLLGITLPSIEHIYKDRMLKKANNIVCDHTHPLASHFNLLPSRRRFCPPLMTKNRSKFYFVPQAIKALNQLK